MKNKNNFLETNKVPLLTFLGMCLLSLMLKAGKITLPEGMAVSEPPLQTAVAAGTSSFEHGDYTVIPLADFDLKAKVIMKTKYSDHWSDICPIDYAMGWEKLSDEYFLKQLKISQDNRWVRYPQSPLPEGITAREIVNQIANMHLCPANDDIRAKLLETPAGSIIHLKGKLIGLNHRIHNWKTASSLSRNDIKDNACEIVWVESFEIKS